MAKRSVDALTWIVSLPPTPALPAPFNQTDWPNPVLARPNFDLRGWIQAPQPTPNAIPNAQRDWPNPLPVRRSIDGLTWTVSIPPIVLPAPINQYDWPNPVLARPNYDVRSGWIQSPQPTPQKPFVPPDFPNPVLARFNYELRGWIQSPLTIFVPPPPPSFFPAPDVTGIHWYQASKILMLAGLNQTRPPIKVKSNRYPPGYVLYQDPVAGTFIAPGTNFTLTVVTEYLDSATIGIYPWFDPTRLT